MYLLDTDILSNLMKRSPSSALVSKVAQVPPEQQFTSSITLGELVYGAHRLRERTAILMQKSRTPCYPTCPSYPSMPLRPGVTVSFEPSWSGWARP